MGRQNLWEMHTLYLDIQKDIINKWQAHQEINVHGSAHGQEDKLALFYFKEKQKYLENFNKENAL